MATRRRVFFEMGLLALVAADTLAHAPLQNPTLPSDVLAPGLWRLAEKIPAPALGEGRVFISPRAEKHLLLSMVPDLEKDFLGKRLALWSNLNLLELMAKVNGSATLQVREEKLIEDLLYKTTNGPARGLLDFLGVRVMTAPGQLIEWAARPSALPMVTVGAKPIFLEANRTFAALTNAQFRPRDEVYLPVEAEGVIEATNRVSGRVSETRFRANRVEFGVDATGPVMVVVAQSFYPNWQARIDGRPARIWRANGAFQAVEVPAGRHRVELVYHDRALAWGGVITALVGLAGIGWMAWPTSFSGRRSAVEWRRGKGNAR